MLDLNSMHFKTSVCMKMDQLGGDFCYGSQLIFDPVGDCKTCCEPAIFKQHVCQPAKDV